MIDQQLLDYIRQQLQQGVSSEQIKQSLIANGWQNTDIEEAFNVVQTSARPKKRRIKTLIKIVLIVFGSLIGIILLINFLPFIFGLVTQDIAPPNIDDLELKTISIPRDDNAYYDLLEFGNGSFSKPTVAIYAPPNLKQILTDYINGKERDEKSVEEIVSKNSAVFAVFDRAAKKSGYQDPATDSPEKISPNTFLASLSMVRRVARLDAIRALYLFNQGKEQEGIDEAIKIIELGQKIQDSQGILLQYLVGMSIKSVGLDVLTSMAERTTLPSSKLISYISKIDRFKNNKEGLRTAFKGEYAIMEKSIDIVLLNPEKSNKSVLPGKYIILNPFNRKGNNFYFRPNETKQLFANRARTQIASINKPCSFIENEKKELFSPSLVKLYFTENAAGKLLANKLAGSSNSVFDKRCNEEFQISADQLLLGIKAYQLEHGYYPASLSELVPRYMNEIPADPFSGEQIRYLASKKILYSVGKDGIDSKGSEGGDWRKMPDPTFKINF